jgi:hypothetical protein
MVPAEPPQESRLSKWVKQPDLKKSMQVQKQFSDCDEEAAKVDPLIKES